MIYNVMDPLVKLKEHCITIETTLLRFIAEFIRHTVKINEFNIALNNRFKSLQNLLKELKITMD